MDGSKGAVIYESEDNAQQNEQHNDDDNDGYNDDIMTADKF